MPAFSQPRKREGGFKRFLRKLFSVRVGTLGSAASTADLHVESGPSRPRRKPPRKPRSARP